MSGSPVVASPAAQIPKKALVALEQAELDAVLLEGAFSEMGHLPVAAVYGQGLSYAEALLSGARKDAADWLVKPPSEGSLVDLDLQPADARFLSQLLALRDLVRVKGIEVDAEAETGWTLGETAADLRTLLLDRAASWKEEPGRRSGSFRVHKGDLGHLYPNATIAGNTLSLGDTDVDVWACFVALPILAPYMIHEDDCFVEPRLE